jgi:AraC-like DNA-binding protein
MYHSVRKTGAHMDPRVRVTLKLIHEHNPLVQFGLAEASGMMGLSEAYLLRLFHREVGKTFRTHLRDERMYRALQLLKQHSRSIKQVACECGYNDISNFYRDFKRVHAITPRELRLRELTALANACETRATSFLRPAVLPSNGHPLRILPPPPPRLHCDQLAGSVFHTTAHSDNK